MNIEKIEKFLEENGQPRFRFEQIKKAVFSDGIASFLEISSLPKDLRERLEQNFQILPFEIQKVLVSKNHDSAKASLKLRDGNLIETVLLSPKPGIWSVCISSQSGCALGCRFCATGKMGFGRNLTTEEIWGQVLFWKQYFQKNLNSKLKIQNSNISSIVFMGMGEPFLNWENVSKSLKFLTGQMGFGSRSISVSTAGIPSGFEKMARQFPQVNLALSLHFADDQKRRENMPIGRKYSLEVLRSMLRNYLEKTNRKVFLEYILLENINDTKKDAEEFISWIESIGKKQLLHVNLIRYNQACEEFEPSLKKKAIWFKNYLQKNHLSVTIRKSLGDEIQGACGQLAGNA